MALGAQPVLSQSDATKSAYKKKTNAEATWASKQDFTSQYTPQVQQAYQNILDRPKFSYDYQTDPVYQGLRDRYVNAGNMANYNTQAQATANTSGYGNSYAQTAGYQAYSNQLNNLMEQIPELAEQRLNRYNQETTDMYNQYDLLSNLEKTDYSRYRDTINDLYNDLLYYQGEYQYLNDQDFKYYQNNMDKWLQDREYYYQQSLLEKQEAALKAAQAAQISYGGGYGYNSGYSGGSSNWSVPSSNVASTAANAVKKTASAVSKALSSRAKREDAAGRGRR